MKGLICLNLPTTFLLGLLQTSVMHLVLSVDIEPTSQAVGILRTADEKAAQMAHRPTTGLDTGAAFPAPSSPH